ncbi:MAG: AAA family ATPase, partial [Acidimicrobiales bacterium]
MANLARTETLIGRSDDVRALALAVTQSRLVTLLGPGGVGKTRLAVELAAELETEYEQVQFIDLTTATVNPLIGDLDGRAATSAYEAIDAASALIVLDNCEHLVDDAAAWISELLASTRRVVVIATSRRPLHLSSEQIYPVRPLSVPLGESDVEKLVAYETVQLFVERAVQAEPSFNLLEANALQVARICELSEGL